MNALALGIHLLMAFGLAYLVGHSVISKPVREFIGGPIDQPRAYFGLLVALVECPACFGTWVGLIVGGLDPVTFNQSSWWAGAFVGACVTAGVNFMLAKATGIMPGEVDPIRETMARMLEQQLMQHERRHEHEYEARSLEQQMEDEALKQTELAEEHVG